MRKKICHLLLKVVNVRSLGDDHSGLGAASPPGIGVDDVVLDGEVIPLVHADAAVGTVVDVVVMDVDVVSFQIKVNLIFQHIYIM